VEVGLVEPQAATINEPSDATIRKQFLIVIKSFLSVNEIETSILSEPIEFALQLRRRDRKAIRL
jgi:hypothetical protein